MVLWPGGARSLKQRGEGGGVSSRAEVNGWGERRFQMDGLVRKRGWVDGWGGASKEKGPSLLL